MILLSFDTEEFDLPCEYGVKHRPVEDGMEVSRYGLVRILDLLKAEDVRATFFCTRNMIHTKCIFVCYLKIKGIYSFSIFTLYIALKTHRIYYE